MTTEEDVRQVLCKPVSVTGEIVNTLGIYVGQAGRPKMDVLYFMPRHSCNSNREFLKSLYPTYLEKLEDIEGKGVCCYLYKVEKIYRDIPSSKGLAAMGEQVDPHHLAAYETWIKLNKDDFINEIQVDVYILSPLCKFPLPKFTPGQNNANLSFYTLEEILSCGQELPVKVEKIQ